MVKLIGTIYQEGENAPEITIKDNAVISFSCERIGVGDFTAKCSAHILNSGYPARWYVADQYGRRYCIQQQSTNTLEIQSFDVDGSPKDGILFSGNNLFEIDM